jgi:hypothetical protein
MQLERWTNGLPDVDQALQENISHHQQQEQQQQQVGEEEVAQASKRQKCSHQQQPQAYQYSLQLLVPAGQLELGRRLITGMYSSSPDLSDLEAPQLLQLVTLAECYGVSKVLAAAAAQLQQLGPESMPLGIAVAVFELPEACLALEALKGVQEAATSKLQQELGDLEVVWGDKDKQQALLGLPLAALLVLLHDKRTQVASEDTAVYTAGRWLEEHPGSSSQQQQQLLGALRLTRCTSSYMASVVAPAASWLRGAGLTEAEALRLCTLTPPGSKQYKARAGLLSPDKAAWHLPVRPASAVQELQVQWSLPLSQIEECILSNNSVTLPHEGSLLTWCGRRWGITSKLLGDCLGLGLAVNQATAGCDAKYCVLGAGGRGVCRSTGECYLETSRGFPKMLDWGADKDWPQIKEWLQQKGLVHPDSCLHLRIDVSNVC